MLRTGLSGLLRAAYYPFRLSLNPNNNMVKTNQNKAKAALLVDQIMLTALELHRTTNYAVFIEHHGHVDWLTIDIRESKEQYEKCLYKANSDDLGLTRLNTDSGSFNLAELEKVLAELQEFLKTGVVISNRDSSGNPASDSAADCSG